MDNLSALEKFKSIRSSLQEGGGEDKARAQREKGKGSARGRINSLLDEDSFVENQAYAVGRTTEFGMGKKRFLGDGVVTGSGRIAGRQVYLSSQDFTVLGGSLGERHAAKIACSQEDALRGGVPFIQINDSGGARIQEGILSLNGYARIFRNNTHSSGVIPQLSIILGPCAGGAVYSPAITDFVFMVDRTSHMYITGPDVIRSVTGEEISHEELGGSVAHSSRSGVAHFRFSSEVECMTFVRQLLGYLPSNNRELPPIVPTDDPPTRKTENIPAILPDEVKQPYDIRLIINDIVDAGSFIEVHREFACNIVVGFGRLGGRTVGIMANQPNQFAAALDIDSSDKGARFLRFCDSFNIPIISLVDVPGYLPGIAQEHGGIIRHGAKLLYAVAEATVPKIALIIRKSYGGSMIAMSSKALGYDRVIAFPTAQVAVMGAQGAANIIFRREIANASDPAVELKNKIEEFETNFMNPYVAAGLGLVDDIIDPTDTRVALIRSLEINIRKSESRPGKKHGNIPL